MHLVMLQNVRLKHRKVQRCNQRLLRNAIIFLAEFHADSCHTRATDLAWISSFFSRRYVLFFCLPFRLKLLLFFSPKCVNCYWLCALFVHSSLPAWMWFRTRPLHQTRRMQVSTHFPNVVFTLQWFVLNSLWSTLSAVAALHLEGTSSI